MSNKPDQEPELSLLPVLLLIGVLSTLLLLMLLIWGW